MGAAGGIVRRSSAALALAALACGAELTATLPPPPHPPRATMVLALLGDGAPRLFVHDLSSGSAWRTPLEGGSPRRVEALVYARPPAELGLAEGELVADPAGRALALAAAYYAAELHPGRPAVGWTQIAEPSAELLAFRFTGRDPRCALFDVSIEMLPTQAEGRFALPLADGAAVVGALDGHASLIDAAGTRSTLPVVPLVELAAGTVGELGDLWLGGRDGRIYRGSVSDALHLASAGKSGVDEPVRAMAAGAQPRGFELYLLSHRGVLEELAGNGFVIRHRFAPPTDFFHGGVARVGPGEAVAVFPTSGSLVRLKNGTAQEEAGPPSPGYSTVAYLPGLGTVAGTLNGGFVLDRGDGWRELTGSPLSYQVTAIAPYPGGFVFGSLFGNLGQWLEDGGFCPLAQPSSHAITSLVVRQQDLLAFGSNYTFPETAVSRLVRRAD